MNRARWAVAMLFSTENPVRFDISVGECSPSRRQSQASHAVLPGPRWFPSSLTRIVISFDQSRLVARWVWGLPWHFTPAPPSVEHHRHPGQSGRASLVLRTVRMTLDRSCRSALDRRDVPQRLAENKPVDHLCFSIGEAPRVGSSCLCFAHPGRPSQLLSEQPSGPQRQGLTSIAAAVGTVNASTPSGVSCRHCSRCALAAASNALPSGVASSFARAAAPGRAADESLVTAAAILSASPEWSGGKSPRHHPTMRHPSQALPPCLQSGSSLAANASGLPISGTIWSRSSTWSVGAAFSL